MNVMNNIVKSQLVIELKSDLVTGSGEGWSNIIDTDIVHDQYGFPYIPARRVKGLLKEAALELVDYELLTESKVDEIFGNEEKEGHHFVLYNAFLPYYEDMKNEVMNMDEKYHPYIYPESVLNQFTSVRYQTSIALTDDEDKQQSKGVALVNSLRSTRAIDKGNKFYAYIEFEENDKDIIEKCLKMVHHMGINRTRGFGEVDLYLENENKEDKKYDLCFEDDVDYDGQLLLENRTQLSLVGTKGEKSLDYIPGSAILGYFANRYLKNNKVDSTFYDLFVKGNVKFSNAYISDEAWNEYYPVKQSLYKEKVGHRYCDKTLMNELLDQNGNSVILSKVRNKYVSNNEYIKEVNKEMYYHHRRPKNKSIGHVVNNENDENGMFYQLEVLCANQRFMTHIRGKGKDLKLVLSDLGLYMQIGKSKSTQYGNVYIHDVKVHKYEDYVIPKGTEVICTLLSPLLNIDEKCQSNLKLSDLSDLLNVENPEYFVDYSTVSGFNAKWRLQKPTYNVFSAGSCVKGVLKEDMPSYCIVGDLTQEGLGQVRIEQKQLLNNKDLKSYNGLKNQKVEPKYMRGIIKEALKHELYLITLNGIKDINVPKIITATLNGRLLKMLEKPTWDDFLIDVDGIANKEKKEQVNQLISKVVSLCDQLFDNSMLVEFENADYKKEYYKQTCTDLLVKYKIEGRDE